MVGKRQELTGLTRIVVPRIVQKKRAEQEEEKNRILKVLREKLIQEIMEKQKIMKETGIKKRKGVSLLCSRGERTEEQQNVVKGLVK
mmetsp:Transcript_28869/g.27762  ORF Transcript_28869/g.27762 Transcript_28869/m.27762 type:complete len:87 (-) Transcript_28869:139-399(-)